MEPEKTALSPPWLAPRRFETKGSFLRATSPRVRIELFDYELPEDRIARYPTSRRDGARLLVVNPRTDALDDRALIDIPDFIPEGALVVLNDTRVMKARLLGEKADTGGRVEIFLVEKLEGAGSSERWRALGRASKPLRQGQLVKLGGGGLLAHIETRSEQDGALEIRLESTSQATVAEAIETHGQVPLPPYMRREPTDEDIERYQTVFARAPGAVAAPTAGLHLTSELLEKLRSTGVEVATLTLHVGLGTFQPVTVDDLDGHPMHAEAFEITADLVEAVTAARQRKKPVVAIGTTVVRALESAACPEKLGQVRPMKTSTRLLIQPGFSFRVVDTLLTNFHLPRSTLLALVSAFAGRERVLHAYGEAVRRGYRFYSYGDAMLIRSQAAPEAR